jgi:hypothetical protein
MPAIPGSPTQIEISTRSKGSQVLFVPNLVQTKSAIKNLKQVYSQTIVPKQ